MATHRFATVSAIFWISVFASFALAVPVQVIEKHPDFINGVTAVANYRISSFTVQPWGLEGELDCLSSTPNPNLICSLKLVVVYQTESRLRFKIYDPNTPRFEVPGVVEEDLESFKKSQLKFTPGYSVRLSIEPFSIRVTRTDGSVMFDSSPSDAHPTDLVFTDRYIEFGTTLDEDSNIYGLGERIHSFRRDSNTYTLFNRDQAASPDLINLYGSQPFYLDWRPSKAAAHGVFLLNSNAMDVIIVNSTLTYKTVGGILDFSIVVGPEPETAIKQYHEVVGRPYFIPYWVLGFHQCRWGYRNLDQIKGVVAGYEDAGIPLDTMWFDIDYMDEKKLWTFDPVNYPEKDVGEFVDYLHNTGRRMVPIIDPGVFAGAGYEPYEDGVQNDVFIKHPTEEKPFLGIVWPGPTHFPDWTHPNTPAYWERWMKVFYEKAQYDGLWNDMNELVSFCHGRCELQLDDPSTWEGCTECENPVVYPEDRPPYIPGKEFLDWRSLTMAARYHDGLEYDYHNINAMLQARVTHVAFRNILKDKRPFLLTRANFPGGGRYTSKWLGDNASTFKDMANSITGIMEYNMYGFPVVGADICGFIGDTTEELCIRWTALGAFYPFARNHNAFDSKPQEPYLWESVTNVSRVYLAERYQLLPFYYTLLYKTHIEGGTIIRPLFFEFPYDAATRDISRQFLVGSSILVTPVVDQGMTSVTGYFPSAIWYDYFTGAVFLDLTGRQGESRTIQTPIDKINVHMRGGSVVPIQLPAMNTVESRKNPCGVVIAFDSNNSASGSLYMDDGITQDTVQKGQYTLVNYRATRNGSRGELEVTVVANGYAGAADLEFQYFRVLGDMPVNVARVNGVLADSSFDVATRTLTLKSQKPRMNSSFTLTWE